MSLSTAKDNSRWIAACRVNDVPQDGGVCVKYNDMQIALFHFTRRNEWYASQNMCPHRKQMALSRGMLGSQQGEPKVACPFHKKAFSLYDGRCMNSDEQLAIEIYQVKVEDDMVYILVPSENHQNIPSCSNQCV